MVLQVHRNLRHPRLVQKEKTAVTVHQQFHLRGDVYKRQTITLAGAASYATPFAAPQNMMTVGWTQYKFVDFCKIGLPMLLVTYVVVAALVPIFLPY